MTPARAPNARNAKPLKLQERDITQACKEFLQLRNWDAVRINAGPFGKSGVGDYVFLHYRRPAILWIEFKSPTDRRTCRCAGRKRGKCTVCAQEEWAAKVRKMGGTVLFVSGIEAFFEWYEARFGVEGQQRLAGLI